MLNHSLYRALERTFGAVFISSSGDNYLVDCPFCGDRRHRLSIHHTWGTFSPGDKWPNLGVALCFNEDCLDLTGRRQELFDMVYPLAGGGRRRIVSIPSSSRRNPVVSSAKPITELPAGDYIPVQELKAHDEARLYLESRGFDCQQLWAERKVLYCQRAPDSSPRIDDRIVVPYFVPPPTWDKTTDPLQLGMVGYIARRPSEDQDYYVGLTAKKYLMPAGFTKSAYLYGLEQSLYCDGPVVVCEGVTDAWRLRRNAVALTGKTMSPRQVELVLRHFRGRPIVVMLDADAQEEAQRIVEKLTVRRLENGDNAAVLCLPPPRDRKDLAECEFEEVVRLISEATDWSYPKLKNELLTPGPVWKYPTLPVASGRPAKRRLSTPCGNFAA